MAIATKVARPVETLLNPLAEDVARDVPVVKRRPEFSPATLARTFILGFLAKPRASVEDRARMAARCSVPVTTQAVGQRLTRATVDFLEALFRRAVRQRVQADRVLAPLLERLPAVFLQDGTAIAVPDELSDRFPGCGGRHGAGRAVIEL